MNRQDAENAKNAFLNRQDAKYAKNIYRLPAIDELDYLGVIGVLAVPRFFLAYLAVHIVDSPHCTSTTPVSGRTAGAGFVPIINFVVQTRRAPAG